MKSSFSVLLFTAVFRFQHVLTTPMGRSDGCDLTTVHQFPNDTWIENMAVRENGEIMATDIAGGKIYLVDPQNSQAEPPVVAQFLPRTCITGIAEVENDVFYTHGLVCDVYNFTFDPNSNSVWEVDMRHYTISKKAAVRKVVDVPEARVLNGMALLSKRDGTILLADSGAGVVWRLNVHTGAYEVVFDDQLLKPVPGSHPEFGINGIHVVDSMLYFTSTNQGLLGTVPISPQGRPTGPATVKSNSVPNADDFAVNPYDGSVWLAENARNTLVRVVANGTVQTVAGGQSSKDLIGPVAATFGRGERNYDVLYVSTDGLTIDPATSKPLITNGKIAALNAKKCLLRLPLSQNVKFATLVSVQNSNTFP